MTNDLVVIGRVNRAHGVHGEVRVQTYSDEVGSLSHYDKLYVQPRNGVRELFTVESHRPQGNFALLKFKGIHHREAARDLHGADILIERDWMPPLEPDEYYWSDLVGLKIVDIEGRDLGLVKQLISTGADDLLVFEKDFEEYYLPFCEEIIRSVDLEAGRISASPPAGLLEL